MKTLILFSLILSSTATHAGDKISDFTKVLNEDIQDQMKNEKFKNEPTLRAPASVDPEVVETPIKDLNKFEKLDGQKSEQNRW